MLLPVNILPEDGYYYYPKYVKVIMYIYQQVFNYMGIHSYVSVHSRCLEVACLEKLMNINLLKPTGYVMHHQYNIQQLYALPTLYLCVLCLCENKQRLVPLRA